ncbi:MAG TPA: hypothetical protein VKY19_14105 [Ktedonosporobacter sp.]|nr:hypothetical protein [Ktedonosporobacter sp.]
MNGNRDPSETTENIERVETLKREMQTSFTNVMDLYLDALRTGSFLPGRDINRDIAEGLFHDHFHAPAIRKEYEQHLDAQDTLNPVRDPLPQDYGLSTDGLEMER